MPRIRIPATEAREKLADILNDVAFRGERVLLERHGKSIAAVVSVEDLELLERLEDEMDLDAARKAIAEKGPRIPWKQFEGRIGAVALVERSGTSEEIRTAWPILSA